VDTDDLGLDLENGSVSPPVSNKKSSLLRSNDDLLEQELVALNPKQESPERVSM